LADVGLEHIDPRTQVDELDVAQSPTDNKLVEFREPFAYIDPVAMVGFILIERLDCPRPRFEPITLGRLTFRQRQFGNRLQG